MFFLEKLSRFSELVTVCETLCCGVFKRIDENRELLELLQTRAPDFLAQHPWVEGWLEGNDEFLTSVASAVGTKNKVGAPGVTFPRPWPGGRSVLDRRAVAYGEAFPISVKTQVIDHVDLRQFAADVHRLANATMFEVILQAFQKTALEYGYSFSRDKSQAAEIGIEAKRALGKAVLMAKWRFVAPLYEPRRGLERAEEDQEDVAWVDSIVEALSQEEVFVIRDKNAPVMLEEDEARFDLETLAAMADDATISEEVSKFFAALEDSERVAAPKTQQNGV